MTEHLLISFFSFFFTGIILFISSIIFFSFFPFSSFFLSSSSLPPFANPSAFQVLQERSKQKGLSRVTFLYNCSLKYQNLSYGSLFRFKFIPFLTNEQVIVTDFKLARIILLGEKEKDIKESIKKNIFQTMNLIDRKINNIFTAKSEDPERESARKSLAPAFSNLNLQKIAPYLNNNILKFFNLLNSYDEKNESVEMGQVILDLIIETLTKSSFDVDFDSKSDINNHEISSSNNPNSINSKFFLHQMDSLVKERIYQMVIPFRRYLFWTSNVIEAKKSEKYVRDTAKRILDIYREKHNMNQNNNENDNIDNINNDNKSTNYIIDRIIAHHYPSDEHRLSEIITFILAGHETSTNTLSFLFYELGKNPLIQKKLQKELDELNTNELLTLNQVSKLEYLNDCIRESMRLWPTAHGVARTTVQDIHYEGFTIPAGKLVQCNFYAMCRQPWIYKANEFIPERWSPDFYVKHQNEVNPQQLNDLKEMFMPFALGHRNCIGQNMAMVQLRLLSANFLKHYEFELVEEVTFEIALLMKPEKLMMRVKRRSV